MARDTSQLNLVAKGNVYPDVAWIVGFLAWGNEAARNRCVTVGGMDKNHKGKLLNDNLRQHCCKDQSAI